MVTVSTRFGYDDRSPEELSEQIRAALGDEQSDGGFRIDGANDFGGESIPIVHSLMESVFASVGSTIDDQATLWISGSFRI